MTVGSVGRKTYSTTILQIIKLPYAAMTSNNIRSYTSLLANNDFKPGEKLVSKAKKASERSTSSTQTNLNARGVASRLAETQAEQAKKSQQPRRKMTKAEEDEMLRHVGSWTEDRSHAGRR
ncbi:hypothetical protein B0A48_12011 [Cryoendolithus antarcticus]|uniref:Uncharacterized protein n=1 Tax=Cryoendolithus antarcticus TaxID=1507870 RepID=A0A1V8STV9_9PEZI|nr:hypothetical protein B0A48_12011 [Cryoendolithus antarcticus]